MNTIKQYYAQRAEEYEEVYRKPERQADLRRLEEILSSAFVGMDVLEIACGTGYWTQFIAKSASSIHGVDSSPEVLELARQKDYGACRISFAVSDAFELKERPSACNAAFLGFWWSHVPIEKTQALLKTLNAILEPGSKVIMIDNRFVEGSSTPISRIDAAGNTYQSRRLKDGSEHEVLKNFPSQTELDNQLLGFGRDIHVEVLPYHWIARYETASPMPRG
jgi:ubiquinone/menaquinone biosynthesis C-methylase UbiE